MAKDTFEEIHGNAGGTIRTGPNLGAAVATAEATCAAQEAGGGAVGGAAPTAPVPLPRLSSFSVYYDQSDKTLKMVDPQVFGPNGTIICGLPEGITDGTYYCNVLKQKKSGIYIAKIETTDANEDDGYKQVCSVKLFTLEGSDFRQFHAGAITVPGGEGVKSLTGDKEGSQPVKGDVAVSADRTGLKVVTEAVAGDGSETEVESMRIEVEGLGDDEAVALREVKDGASGETVARVMGTADVELPAGVTSLNEATGDVSVIGGENIEVTTDGNTITVSYREGKEPDEPPGADPCAHDDVGGEGGGISASGGATGMGDTPAGGVPAGGVPAGGDAHPGDNDCNCN